MKPTLGRRPVVNQNNLHTQATAITAGRLQVVRGDGDVIRDYPVALIRKPDLIVHEEPKLMAPSTLNERVEMLPQD